MHPSVHDLLRLLAAVNQRHREDVSLTTLATLAHRSRFNLHRRWRRVVGETPRAYTERVRLARAAADLVTTRQPVSRIAQRHGYASHEVFTRAFRRHLGLSPTAYRRRGLHVAGAEVARVHAATIESAGPCVGLYRLTTRERIPRMDMDVTLKDLPEVYLLVRRRRVTRDEIAATLGEFLPAVFTYAQTHGLALAGPPLARYPEVGMGSLVLEAGFPIAAPPPELPGEGIELVTIPAGRAAVAIHPGPYDHLPATYAAIEQWLDAEGLKAAGPPWESYVTDPGEHPDPSTWLTEVVQPVA